MKNISTASISNTNTLPRGLFSAQETLSLYISMLKYTGLYSIVLSEKLNILRWGGEKHIERKRAYKAETKYDFFPKIS